MQPDGYVMLKDAGMVEVQGLNLQQFIEAVQKAYRGYLHDPQVAVVLKDFDRPYFIVGGQVGKPGKYELRSDTTVAEAVEIAGGLTSQSKHSQVVLFRRVNDDLLETRLLDLKKMLNQRNLKEDDHLRPGDLVFVPQNTISKIARYLTQTLPQHVREPDTILGMGSPRSHGRRRPNSSPKALLPHPHRPCGMWRR